LAGFRRIAAACKSQESQRSERRSVFLATQYPGLALVSLRLALLANASEIDAAVFQPRMGLPTEPIQRFELGFECFDRFNCAVGPFSLDRPVASTLYYEKYRFALKLAQGAHFMRATGFAFGNCILSPKNHP
jgi:hypothetical protein